MLVIRPIHHRVGPGERHLDDSVGVVAHETELVDILRTGDRGLLDDCGLGVVLVVERAHGSPRFEPARVRGNVVVHLGPALLAVVDHVDAGAFEKPERVEGRPTVYLGALQSAAPEPFDKLLVTVHLEALSPTLRVGDVVVFERPARERLHAPGGLGQAADLAGDEPDAHTATSLNATRPR